MTLCPGAVVSFLFFCSSLLAADSGFEPLWNYQGTWEATMAAPGAKPASNKVQNDCVEFTQYFICQQTVDGKVVALLTFTPAATKGHFYTDPVFPDGRAAGRGELEIEGDRWTYPSKEERDGKTKFYRIVNVFSGKDRIHFERSESDDDGKTWRVLATGDESRLSHDGTRPDPRRK